MYKQPFQISRKQKYLVGKNRQIHKFTAFGKKLKQALIYENILTIT